MATCIESIKCVQYPTNNIKVVLLKFMKASTLVLGYQPKLYVFLIKLASEMSLSFDI